MAYHATERMSGMSSEVDTSLARVRGWVRIGARARARVGARASARVGGGVADRAMVRVGVGEVGTCHRSVSSSCTVSSCGPALGKMYETSSTLGIGR
jgi:hypothetical protein